MLRDATCRPLEVITLSSHQLPVTNRLWRTATALNVPVRLIPCYEHGKKRRLYVQELQTMCPETFVLCMDGYDTFFRCDATDLRNRLLASGARVLVAAERLFSFQHPSRLPLFDELWRAHGNGSSYRYLNSGIVGGRARDLLTFYNYTLQLPAPFHHLSDNNAGSDQAYVSDALLDTRGVLPHPRFAQLDYGNSVSYSASGKDWGGKGHNRPWAIDRVTKTDPCIVHVPGQGIKNQSPSPTDLLNKLFEKFARGNVPAAVNLTAEQRAVRNGTFVASRLV